MLVIKVEQTLLLEKLKCCQRKYIYIEKNIEKDTVMQEITMKVKMKAANKDAISLNIFPINF